MEELEERAEKGGIGAAHLGVGAGDGKQLHSL